MKALILITTLIFTALACGRVSEDAKTKSIVFNGGARWASPQAIPVCWENPGRVSQELKDDIKTKMIAEFNRTQIRFSRFDNCTGADLNATMIRVHFKLMHNWDVNTQPSSSGGQSWLGPSSQAIPGGVAGAGTMSIGIGTRGAYPPVGHPWRQYVMQQTRRTALHEFGHAIGLHHEHNRTDGPACQSDTHKEANAGNFVYVGAYDPTSIMNYCAPGDLSSLTPGDIAGVNFLYPPKPSATALPAIGTEFYLTARHSQKCVDIAWASLLNLAPAQQYGCNQTGAQRFRLTGGADGTYSLQNTNSGKCLDVERAGQQNGSRVIQWNCSGQANQRVRIKPSNGGHFLLQFVHSNKCLDISAFSTLDRAPIHQWDCNPDAGNQNFFFKGL